MSSLAFYPPAATIVPGRDGLNSLSLLDRHPPFMFERVAGGRAALISIATEPAATAGRDEPFAAALRHRLMLRSVIAHRPTVALSISAGRLPDQPAPGLAWILAVAASLQVPEGTRYAPSQQLGFRSA